jgi:hypothetical protein
MLSASIHKAKENDRVLRRAGRVGGGCDGRKTISNSQQGISNIQGKKRWSSETLDLH